jgi:hypothetical protein
MATMKDAALAYIKNGFKVFPVKTDKTPLTEHGLKDATQIIPRVNDFWQKWPDAGIGLVTDGFIVLDFDLKSGGIESKVQIEKKYGDLPKTRIHKTGGGGLHYIYKNPNGTNVRNTVGFAGYSGVDIRANGGYIVAPPSPHASGKRYEVLENSPIIPAPDWLIELIKQKLTPNISTTPVEGTPIPEGQRNATLTKLAGAMRRQGMTETEIYAALQVANNRCQPGPLPDNEILTISKSVARYQPSPNYGPSNTPNNLEILDNLESVESLENLGGLENSRNILENVLEVKVEANQYHNVSRMVEKWINLHKDETFDLDIICRQLGVNDPKTRNLVTIKLAYEAKRKNLEKSNRLYRYIDNTIVNIPWYENGTNNYFDITFPSNHDAVDNSYFSFQDSVRLSPASVTVVAGQTNAGKSTFARHIVWDNMDKHHVRYLVSQTSAAAFARYANNMTWANPMKSPNQPKFELIERYEDFQDLILPNAVNIVDWLDADKVEYYKIGSLIKAMQTKLVNGILFVMIQKNSFGEFGDGGEKSAKWADLYLTLNYNREKNFTRLSILKAKEWIGNHDPNGRNYGFEIINYGSQLSNIREVKKCTVCYGQGRNKSGTECNICAGVGYIDSFRSVKKIDKCAVCGSIDFQDIKGMRHCANGHYCG